MFVIFQVRSKQSADKILCDGPYPILHIKLYLLILISWQIIEVWEKGHIFRILATSEGAVYLPGKGVGKYLVTTGAAWDPASNRASPTDSSKKRIGQK